MLSNARKAKIYEDMLDTLVHDGWIKGALQNGRAHCTIGAVEHATRHYQESIEIQKEIVRILADRPLVGQWIDTTLAYGHLGQQYRAIADWNDKPWRRKRDVIRLVERQAKKYRKLAEQDRIASLERKQMKLESEIDRLRRRVEELEIENLALLEEVKWWKARRAKVTARELAESNSELASLDAELDAVAAELEMSRP